MKLIIKRGYVEGKKGFLGGKSERFTIYFKAELTPEEIILIEKYKLDIPSITENKSVNDEYTEKNPLSIINGFDMNAKDIDELIEKESGIVNLCKHFQYVIDKYKLVGAESVLYFSNESKEIDFAELQKAELEKAAEEIEPNPGG